MPVVTINGWIGSRALNAGPLVAQNLGIDYLDQQVIIEAARRIGATVEAVAQRDRRPTTFGERMARFMRDFLERSAVGSLGDPLIGPAHLEMVLSRTYAQTSQPPTSRAQEVDDQTYITTIKAIIGEAAQGGHVVIVGRASNFILKDLPKAVHFYMVAPLADRIQEIIRREQLDRAAALKYIQETDRDRRAFCRKFFNADTEDPLHYQVILNTAGIPLETIASLVTHTTRVLTS